MSSASRSSHHLTVIASEADVGVPPRGASIALWHEADPTMGAWVEVLAGSDERSPSMAALMTSYRAAEQASLLARGLAQLDRQEWAAADETLVRARDLRLDNAEVLSALALARVHNPTLDAEQRHQQAVVMVELATLLDPEHAGVQAAAAQVRGGLAH